MIARAAHGPKQSFLSLAMSDRMLAMDVSRILENSGLDVLSASEVSSGYVYDNQIRNALTSSDAVVVVLSEVERRKEIPASVLFEIGAATGANKPIFVSLKN